MANRDSRKGKRDHGRLYGADISLALWKLTSCSGMFAKNALAWLIGATSLFPSLIRIHQPLLDPLPKSLISSTTYDQLVPRSAHLLRYVLPSLRLPSRLSDERREREPIMVDILLEICERD